MANLSADTVNGITLKLAGRFSFTVTLYDVAVMDGVGSAQNSN